MSSIQRQQVAWNSQSSLHTKKNSNLEGWLKERSFLIVSYTINFNGKTSHYLSGPSQDLLVYLRQKGGTVVFFEQPDPVSENLQPKAVVYKNGEKIRELTFPMFWFPLKKGRREIASTPMMYCLFKLRDFLSTLYFGLKLHSRYDVCVAVESPNAVTAILMKIFRLSRKVIYDMIDYSPRRFENPILNRIFHFLDKWCVYHADFVWNQTGKVAKFRFEKGYKEKKCAPQLVKLTGVLPHKIKQLPINQIKRYQIVYMGSFLKRDGVEVLLKAFRDVARKVSSANLILIGEGELKESLIHYCQQQGLEKQTQFLGMIEDEEALEKILLCSAMGLAPYADEAATVKVFNDVSKPKVYLSCGLPVVITRVPYVAEEIQRYGAGVSVSYNKEEMANAILRLLTDDRFFQHARQNALKMAKDYSWNNIFDALFKPVAAQDVEELS